MSQDWTPAPDAWRRAYGQAGYLVVENAVDAHLLHRMREKLEDIQRQVSEGMFPAHLRKHLSLEGDRPPHQQSPGSDPTQIFNMMELPLYDPLFANLILYPRVLDILEALFETTEFAFHNYKCICKMPGSRNRFQWHRDLPYLPHTSANLLTCMLCVDAMTAENGATVVCPGSHLVGHAGAAASYIEINDEDVPAERVTVECPAGSAVVFHVNLIHGGGANTSDRKRRNVIGIWSGPDALPVTPSRYAYMGVMPRSRDSVRQKQIAMSFGP